MSFISSPLRLVPRAQGHGDVTTRIEERAGGCLMGRR
jgi:hypothetical protein